MFILFGLVNADNSQNQTHVKFRAQDGVRARLSAHQVATILINKYCTYNASLSRRYNHITVLIGHEGWHPVSQIL